jgi:hypothetical protein
LANPNVRRIKAKVQDLQWDKFYNISFLVFAITEIVQRDQDNVPIRATFDFLREYSVMAVQFALRIREVRRSLFCCFVLRFLVLFVGCLCESFW